ncbi:hypothetical protein T03_10033 [Trichinella britovi]|uniref:Uncharacterized protein n=1 Tax=Trichinella britovi TaxID=45882 RepID=A0A0V1AGX7_TRIBR|nr:hypothetical protein T03_10033 [Trichinella britovi]
MEKYSNRCLRNGNSTRKLKLVRRFREDHIYEKLFMSKEEHALLRFHLQMLQHVRSSAFKKFDSHQA